MFFVISGFVITRILLREQTGSGHIGLLPFYARRARRILPAAMLVILVMLIAERALIGGAIVEAVTEDARWATVFLANYPRPLNLIVARPISNYWSLAVEEQFYVVYPALFIAACALGRRWPLRIRLGIFLGIVIAISYTWSVVHTPVSPYYSYTSTFTRA